VNYVFKASLSVGKYSESLQWGRAALAIDPGNYWVKLRMAAAYTYGRWSALNGDTPARETLAADFPSDATVLMGLGWANLKQGKKAAARENFARVKLMFPENKYADEGLTWAK
jgi:tetratricopeptide (TPR) repeat protein